MLFAVVSALLPCAGSQASQRPGNEVSLIQLIANPERYEGQTVSVSGFLHLEFEGNFICLHREDCEQHLYQNSLWVNPSADLRSHIHELNDHYITLYGQFTAKRGGHMGLWPGELSVSAYVRHGT